MSTSMNKDRPQTKPTLGLLLIIGEIISNEQRDDVCFCLDSALQQVDSEKYREIHDLFNHLIHENEFQADSQYRQIANTESGSTAAFLYLPNFHTLSNVLKDLFNTCYHVCVIFCGQQVDSNGALILSDSTFTSENFRSLFEENPGFLLQDLQLVLPLVSSQWSKLLHNYLQKQLEHVQIDDLSHQTNQESSFGQRFYERVIQALHNDSVNFDIYAKLTPRDSSGTIAFDEPNLYIFYGQQGEASLFGVRGFVVLINGGFSRTPSYWNIIRGLQTIDACILTHFDYDVFPGLQTIVQRKRTLSSSDDQLCKPDIGAIFLNHMHRTKLQSASTSKSQSNNSLLVDLTQDVDHFLQNIKQLNIDTFHLLKHTASNKQTVEPINLYKKIAFGSLDLFVLHPTSSPSEDDKLITALQKVSIGDQQVLPSTIPHHHWYSSCLLLVWTPSAKSNKDSPVRVLYTGACPQTLVFDALSKARHLDFLHESQTHPQTGRTSNDKAAPSVRPSPNVKVSPQKPKLPTPVNHRAGSSTVQNKTAKPSPRPNLSKPKVPPPTATSSKTPRTPAAVKKVPPMPATRPTRSASKEKKPSKPQRPSSKTSGAAKPVKTHAPKVKPQADQKPKSKAEVKPKNATVPEADQKQQSEATNGHVEELEIKSVPETLVGDQHDDEERPREVRRDEEQTLDIQNDHDEDLLGENEDEQNRETEVDDEQALESQNNEFEQSDENEPSVANDLDEQQFSTDELNESNEVSADNHDNDIRRPQSISLATNQHETSGKSNSVSPVDEMTSQLSPRDPTATSFTDGASDAEDPFTEINDDHIAADEMEIIHHHASGSAKHPMPSIDDISPQGLPIDKHIPSKQPSSGKLSHGTGIRTNGPARQPKQMSASSSLSSVFHVDVAYIPYHGNEHYVDSEFFRRIHARYYILNAVQTSPQTLESFLNGIAQWNGKGQLLVTLVPTFDSEQLRQFFVVNKNRLAELNINILPASSRCNVQYDNESSPAQLLRFGSNSNVHEQ